MDGLKLRFDAEIDKTDLAGETALASLQERVGLDRDQMADTRFEAGIEFGAEAIDHVGCYVQREMLALPLSGKRMEDGVPGDLSDIELTEHAAHHSKRQVNDLLIRRGEMTIGAARGFRKKRSGSGSPLLSALFKASFLGVVIGLDRFFSKPLRLARSSLLVRPSSLPGLYLFSGDDATARPVTKRFAALGFLGRLSHGHPPSPEERLQGSSPRDRQ